MCAKDRATSLGAEHADDVSDDMSIEEDNSSVSGTEGFLDDTLKRKTTSSTSTLSSKSKKVKVEDTIATAMSEMASSIKEMASTMVLAASTKATVTVDEVYEEVITIPNLDEDVCWKAIELFANNVTKFQVLKKIPLEKKSDFVLKSMP